MGDRLDSGGFVALKLALGHIGIKGDYVTQDDIAKIFRGKRCRKGTVSVHTKNENGEAHLRSPYAKKEGSMKGDDPTQQWGNRVRMSGMAITGMKEKPEKQIGAIGNSTNGQTHARRGP